MNRDDMYAVGQLVLIAVIVGAAITAGGPALSKALLKVIARWLK